MTDGTTVTAEYEYGPFGEVLKVLGEIGNEMPSRFSSKYQDFETGLVYYGFRYYSPMLGMWIKRDPIEEDGGNNIYAFIFNNPTNAIDIDGRKSLLAGGSSPTGARIIIEELGETAIKSTAPKVVEPVSAGLIAEILRRCKGECYDDAKRKCKCKQIKVIELRTDPTQYNDDGKPVTTGHTFIMLPSGAYGFYPRVGLAGPGLARQYYRNAPPVPGGLFQMTIIHLIQANQFHTRFAQKLCTF